MMIMLGYVQTSLCKALAKGEANISRGAIDELLGSPDLYERMGAIYSIGETKEESYIPILLQYLNDPSYLVQRNVCDAMIKFGIKMQGILLKEIRTGKSEKFLLGALRVLTVIADKKALKTLLKLRITGKVRSGKLLKEQSMKFTRELCSCQHTMSRL